MCNYFKLLTSISVLTIALILGVETSNAQGPSCTEIADCTSEFPTCLPDPVNGGMSCTAVICMNDSDCSDFPDTNTCVQGLCNDGVGPAPIIDFDLDGIADAVDNCPKHHNPGQEDMDGDGIGDRCDFEPVPTLSEWGLIAMAGVLGLVGFFVIRKRKVVG